MHDRDMPQGWHTIKSVLLREIRTAANFHLCDEAAGALFHARLLGESCAKETKRLVTENQAVQRSTQTEEPEG